MPTYDYECAACGHRFERFEKVHDDGSKACARCGKRRARRLLGTGAGVIFKGSGFHVTDYSRSGKPAASGGDSTAKAEPAKKKTVRKEKKD